MPLTARLREPIILDETAPSEQIYELIRDATHPFVFILSGPYFFPVKTLLLFRRFNENPGQQWNLREFLTEPPCQPIPLGDLRRRILDVLAQEVVLTESDATLRYITREELLISFLADDNPSETKWLNALFSSIPRGLIVANLDYSAVNCNAEAARMLRLPTEDLLNTKLSDMLGTDYFIQVQMSQTPLLNQVITVPNTQATILVDFTPLLQNRSMSGYALVLQDLPSVEAMAMELDSVKDLNQDLETILSTIYDEIIVVDSKETLLRCSAHCIQSQWELPPHKFIGRNVREVLPSENLMLDVIEQVRQSKVKVSRMNNSGEAPLLCVGNPIFNKHGKLERIVIASRDLTEVARLQRELEMTKKQSENYRKKFEQLREQLPHLRESGPVYSSREMQEVMKEVERIAQFSATVLLTGESGVGKEVVANAIHSLSARKNHPLIKINCASIPESLLESELFGYVKGAFSGAKSEGKTGLFVKADKGTLFLDEISELPLNIQSKLLRAIQEREVYPVGSTSPVQFDVHLICASNRPLHKLVESGEFREDLFYRINVFPILIPPLRERREDIAVLAHHMLYEFNQTYGRNLRFSNRAIEVLEAYSFPGNIRELQNLVQRVAIKTDEEMIDTEVVEKVLLADESRISRSTSLFSSVIPLKQAVEQVEQELVLRAMEQYRTTVAAAKALGISQASVSRKYQQLKAQRQRRRR